MQLYLIYFWFPILFGMKTSLSLLQVRVYCEIYRRQKRSMLGSQFHHSLIPNQFRYQHHPIRSPLRSNIILQGIIVVLPPIKLLDLLHAPQVSLLLLQQFNIFHYGRILSFPFTIRRIPTTKLIETTLGGYEREAENDISRRERITTQVFSSGSLQIALN